MRRTKKPSRGGLSSGHEKQKTYSNGLSSLSKRVETSRNGLDNKDEEKKTHQERHHRHHHVIPSNQRSTSSAKIPLIMFFLIPINPLLLFGVHYYHSMHHDPAALERIRKQQQQQRANRKSELLSRTNTTTLPPLVISPDSYKASKNTVVTAYFSIRSKYQKSKYDEWMKNMLSLNDAMVIFINDHDAQLHQQIRQMRQHAMDRTHIIPLSLEQNVSMATNHSLDFWKHQYKMDPERRKHASYEVFWIWLSKVEFLQRAIAENPFQSTYFMWSDIGCFRGARIAKQYAGQQMMRRVEEVLISNSSMLFLAHKAMPLEPPPTVWWTNKLKEPNHFYHSGTMMVGHVAAVQAFGTAFQETFQGFVQRNLFVGDDQTVLQCTCLQHPWLCMYITRDQVHDNHYFGLRYATMHGGHYDYWRPPGWKNKSVSLIP